MRESKDQAAEYCGSDPPLAIADPPGNHQADLLRRSPKTAQGTLYLLWPNQTTAPIRKNSTKTMMDMSTMV